MDQNQVVQVKAFAQRVRESVERAIIGKSEVVTRVIGTVLAGGHILFEDYPGLGKTLLAHSLARSMKLDFKRIQFTPDLLPADITGGYIFNRDKQAFELQKGPIFTNILLADELNRASPKTQSALLEAMQEGHVTLDGTTLPLPEPFVVLATQNPIEYEGTFPLPEAQLDRFLAKLSIGYPDARAEQEILHRRRERKEDQVQIDPVTSIEEVLAMKELVEEVFVHEDLEAYIVSLVRKTRTHTSINVGASPRGSLAIMKLARAAAAIDGRTFVIPDDIKAAAGPALGHRIALSPEFWMRENVTTEVIDSVIASVRVPVIDSP
ncbi:MAG: AAA family ATPase [Spirochaetales bacterium]